MTAASLYPGTITNMDRLSVGKSRLF